MMRLFVVFVAVFVGVAQLAKAQSADQVVWVQIEAQPNLQDGIARAQSYALTLADVNGFALGGGWYGIVLGPYTAADAEQVLQVYRNDGIIPRDSYIAFTSSFEQQFFPQGADLLQQGALNIETIVPPGQDVAIPIETPQASQDITLQGLSQAPERPVQISDETPSEARRSERDLSAQERRDIQTALQWAGFYNASIDGAFGRGTRTSMSAWQQANGFEATGVLTTVQRAALIQSYNAVLEGLGLRLVTDSKTGIEITMPTAKVALDRYEAPFAQYNATDGSAARVLLISQEGDVNTLASLYEIMQTLEIVPLEGARSLQRSSFSLIGRNSEIVSETQVSLENGHIKGFTLIWPAGDEERRRRLLSEMQDSFFRLDGVLDPLAGIEEQQQIDLIAGLEIRKPRISRSGFFVDGRGSVVTTSDAVQNCTRITLDEEYEADLNSIDAGLGIAILKPSGDLAPSQIARFSPAPPRLQSDVAVAGYSYEGLLDAPTMTFGTLADVRGLTGEQELSRLALSSLPGDAGGPVFDNAGNVLGMLLPRGGGERQLPQEVTFALAGSAISRALTNAGLTPGNGNGDEPIAPEDITERALAVTVLVSCWE